MRAWVLVLASGCVMSSPKPPAIDGTSCSIDEDCTSHQCQGSICVNGGCKTSADCGVNGSCEYESGGIFSDGGYYCSLKCDAAGACPAQFACDRGYCLFEGPTFTVTHTPMEIRGNEPAEFTVTLSPPLNASFVWTFDTGFDVVATATGASVSVTLPPNSYSARVDATIGKDAFYTSIPVVACFTSGEVVSSYEFCCSGETWDPTTQVCQ